MVPARIRAVPCSRRRASLRVDLWVLTTPMRGSWMCLRSGSSLIAPVVNRQASRQRPFFLNCGKPIRRPLRRPLLRVAPVPQRSGQPIQAGGVGLLGVLRPPRGNLVLRPVPFPPQLGQGPWHRHLRVGSVLVEVGLDQRQTPVVGDPGGSAVGGKGTPCNRRGAG